MSTGVRKKPKLIASGRDRISNLPESILTHIISRLPTEDVVQTCVLSTSWKYKWLSLDNFQISDSNCDNLHETCEEYCAFSTLCQKVRSGNISLDGILASIFNIIEKISLFSHHVKSFSLSCWDKYDSSRMAACISAIVGDSIETFKLLYAHEGLVLPRSLLKCSSLTNLELKLQCMLRVPVVNNFSNLVNIYLHSVEILNEDSNTDTMILKFKVLKTCKLYSCKWLNVKYVEFLAPALTTFKLVYIPETGVDCNSYKILGAKLDKFEIDGGLNFALPGSTVAFANLICMDTRHPKIFGDFGLEVRKLLRELSTVKYLILTSDVGEGIRQPNGGLTLPTYGSLERLDINYGGEPEGLMELLHAMPFLKFLAVKVTYGEMFDFWDTLKPVPSCVVSFLEEVKVERYFYLHHRLQLEKFMLKNGTHLKKIILSSSWDLPQDEILKELSAIPKASASLDIVTITLA